MNLENSRERSMRLILEKVSEIGSAQIEDLKKLVPLCENTIYRVCTRAVEEGYVRLERVKKEGVCGRQRCVYTRTDKPYTPVMVSEKTIQNRKWAERMAGKDAGVVPFRHWQDQLMFGAPAPFEPKIGTGRIYRQEMSVNDDDEMEQAA